MAHHALRNPYLDKHLHVRKLNQEWSKTIILSKIKARSQNILDEVLKDDCQAMSVDTEKGYGIHTKQFGYIIRKIFKK